MYWKHSASIPFRSSRGEQYRIRPGPDPDRKEETTWMTEQQIQDEVMNESKNWLDAGSGKLGRLYLEVIECDGLPNLDTGGFLGNKTDGYVIVFVILCTACCI